jgi:hypothetical protein
MSKNTQLTKMQKTWYKKLAKTGFEDIEYFTSDMEPTQYFKSTKTTLGRASCDMHIKYDVRAFYLLLTHWPFSERAKVSRQLLKGQLTEQLVEKAWLLYVDGYKYSEIYSIINGTKKRKIGLKLIKSTIQKLEAACMYWHTICGDLRQFASLIE